MNCRASLPWNVLTSLVFSRGKRLREYEIERERESQPSLQRRVAIARFPPRNTTPRERSKERRLGPVIFISLRRARAFISPVSHFSDVGSLRVSRRPFCNYEETTTMVTVAEERCKCCAELGQARWNSTILTGVESREIFANVYWVYK